MLYGTPAVQARGHLFHILDVYLYPSSFPTQVLLYLNLTKAGPFDSIYNDPKVTLCHETLTAW